ncbi:FG-GAP repeat protein, partial [Synechocystis salina LEGE 00031]|nr:FG-GAP repeat protein [Synechocystis salina LEGE 00031]
SSLNLADLNGSNGFVINGIDSDDQSGRSVSSAGDVNGDGFDDLLIGASGGDPNGVSNAGESYVVFGSADIGASGIIELTSDPLFVKDFSAVFQSDAAPVAIVSPGLTLSDANSATLAGATITISNLLDGTDEVLSATATGPITVSYSNGVLTLAGNGTVAEYEQVLRTVTYNNTSPNIDTTDRLITFVVDDGKTFQNLSQVVTTTLRILSNKAPTITSAPTASFNENDTGVVYTVTANDPEGATLTYSLGGIDGALFTIDSKTGQVTFLAPPDFEDSNDDDGDNVYNITVTANDGLVNSNSQDVAITVINVNEAPTITSGTTANFAENGIGTVYTVTATDPESDSITYGLETTGDYLLFDIDSNTGIVTFKTSPDFENPTDIGTDNVYDITVTASDGLLSDSQAIVITVTDVNEAPTITSGTTANFAENGTGTVYTVTATDPESDSITYGLETTGDYLLFDIDSNTGVVTFKTSPDFENPTDIGTDNVYDITVTASDGLLSDSQAIVITVTNVNEAPTDLALSANSINENVDTTGGVLIGDLTITDPDASGNNNVLTVEGTDAGDFEIRNGNQLFFIGASPDFETKPSYDITIKTTDGALIYTEPFTIAVNDVNEAPTDLSLDNTSINENIDTTGGVLIGDLTITDPDASGNNNVLTVEGTDAAKFEIRNGNQLFFIGASPNFATKPSYDITIKTTDGALIYTELFTITVNDVNEAPTDLSLDNTGSIPLLP